MFLGNYYTEKNDVVLTSLANNSLSENDVVNSVLMKQICSYFNNKFFVFFSTEKRNKTNNLVIMVLCSK